MRTPQLFRELAIGTALVACFTVPAAGQTTIDAIKARLVGQPLYLRGRWLDNRLKFGPTGVPAKQYASVPFTEAGIDVRSVRLSPKGLLLEGRRMGLVFRDSKPERIHLGSTDYDDDIDIEIAAPPDGDFSSALTAIFAPDLAAMVPTMPIYWQSFARSHLVKVAAAESAGPEEKAGIANTTGSPSEKKAARAKDTIEKPKVLYQVEPQFTPLARTLRYSGMVTVYCWVMPDGSTAHLSIVKPAGLGLDEQALLAVSRYQFKPATKDGKPVAVDLYVDVNFQIR